MEGYTEGYTEGWAEGVIAECERQGEESNLERRDGADRTAAAIAGELRI